MSQKYLATYKRLAASRGHSEPLQYLFGRFSTLVKQGKHDEAQKIAMMLVPYGHGKVAPVDGDTGETVSNTVFVLD